MAKSLTKDFTQGNIAKQLMLFALPFMASNALQVLYSTIDMIVVGSSPTGGASGRVFSFEHPDNSQKWAFSSIGQSNRLITGRLGVRVPKGPPFLFNLIGA